MISRCLRPLVPSDTFALSTPLFFFFRVFFDETE